MWLEIVKTHYRYSIGTNCAPLVAYLVSFCYERDFMLPLSDKTQADAVESFVSTSIYLAYSVLALLCVMLSCVFFTFPYGVMNHEWNLIVSIPDVFLLP